METRAPHVFGLTGGIASGKTTVAKLLRALGCPVVDADVLARQVVETGSAGLIALVRAFGEGILGADGSLNRRALGDLVFKNEEERARLNSILHPRIAEAAQEAFRRLARGGAQLIAYDVPLLFETGQEDRYRPVVLTFCSPETQVERIMARDQLTREAALSRIAAQMPLAEKAKLADHVIHTEGSMEATAEQTKAVFRKISEGNSGSTADVG